MSLSDLTYHHPSPINILRPAHSHDAQDLIAVAGNAFLDVVHVHHASCTRIASFHVGAPITALAWSRRSVSPSVSDTWSIELVAATSDYSLHLLTKSSNQPENIFVFGGGLSGHHAKINDMTFCGGWDSDSTRYLATVSDDKTLMVWDLEPTSGVLLDVPDDSMDSPASRSRPTAYVIPFSHPLCAIRANPSNSKEFIVADSQGAVFLTDWRADPDDQPEEGALRQSTLVELIDPTAISLPHQGLSLPWAPSIDWRSDNSEILGGTFGTRFSLWDLSKLRGGAPYVSGTAFSEGPTLFRQVLRLCHKSNRPHSPARWSRTFAEYFAISVHSPTEGAVIHIYNCNYVHATPDSIPIAKKPLFIRDFDFLSLSGIPRIAAAVGNSVLIFPIGEDV